MANTITFYTYLSGKNATTYTSDIVQAYAGDFFLFLTQGSYYVEMYGAGGGGGGGTSKGSYIYGGGGSGAGFKGYVNLITGMYYVKVGLRGTNGAFWNSPAAYNSGTAGGATILKNVEKNVDVISCGGGGTQSGAGTAAGGTISYNSTYVVNTPELASNGNSNGFTGFHYASWGGVLPGGLSLYDNTHNGYGRGGYAFHIDGDGAVGSAGTCASGLDGYFKIKCAGKISSMAYNCKDVKLSNKYYSFSNTVVVPEPEPTLKMVEYTTPGTYTLTLPKSGSMYVEAYGAGGGSSDTNGKNASIAGPGTINSAWGVNDNTLGPIFLVNKPVTIEGGGGAGFKGYLTLSAGTYTIVVGSGGSRASIPTSSSVITANTSYKGGTGGSTIFSNSNNSIISCAGGTGAVFSITGIRSSTNCSMSAGSGGTFTGNTTYYSDTPILNKGGNAGASAKATSVTSRAVSLYDNTNSGYGAGGNKSTGKNGYFRIDMLI